MYDMDTEQIAYTVREPRWAFFLTVPFCVLTLVLAFAAAWTWHDESREVHIVLVACCGLFLIVSVLAMLDLCLRSLMVLEGGRGFIHRSMFGKKTYFTVRDIACVVLGSNGARGPYLRILHKDERVICTLEMNMVPVDRLLSDFEEKGISIREENASDRLKRGGAAARARAEKELILASMTDEEYEEYARSAKRWHTASKVMQLVSVILAVFVIRSRAVTFDQMSLVFSCWPIVFLVFCLLGHRHFSIYDPTYLRRHGAPERYVETVVPFPFLGMLAYTALSMTSMLLVNDAKEWATFLFALSEMVLVLLIVFLVVRRRISVLAVLLLLPLVFMINYSHAIHLNWTLGTKHTEIARVVRTEIVEGENNDYYVYVNDESGQPVRYAASGSIVTKTRAGDTVTLLINDSIFGIRQIIVTR